MKTISPTRDIEDRDLGSSKEAAKSYTGRESSSGLSASRRDSARLQAAATKEKGPSSPPTVRRGSKPLDSIKEPAFAAAAAHQQAQSRGRAPSLDDFPNEPPPALPKKKKNRRGSGRISSFKAR